MSNSETTVDIDRLIAAVRSGTPQPPSLPDYVGHSDACARFEFGRNPFGCQGPGGLNRSVLHALESIARQMRGMENRLSMLDATMKLISARQEIAARGQLPGPQSIPAGRLDEPLDEIQIAHSPKEPLTTDVDSFDMSAADDPDPSRPSASISDPHLNEENPPDSQSMEDLGMPCISPSASRLTGQDFRDREEEEHYEFFDRNIDRPRHPPIAEEPEPAAVAKSSPTVAPNFAPPAGPIFPGAESPMVPLVAALIVPPVETPIVPAPVAVVIPPCADAAEIKPEPAVNEAEAPAAGQSVTQSNRFQSKTPVTEPIKNEGQRIAPETHNQVLATPAPPPILQAMTDEAAEELRNDMNAVARRMDEAVDSLGSVNGTLAEIDHRLERLETELPDLMRGLSELRRASGDADLTARGRTTQLEERIAQNENAIEHMQRHLLRAERASRLKAETSTPPKTDHAAPQPMPSHARLDWLIPPAKGGPSSELARQRQAACVEIFRGRADVVCLSCENGDLLKALLTHGIRATGVEADPELAGLHRDLGLPVTLSDPLEYLNRLPELQTEALFLGRWVRRMPPDQILRVLEACQKKLRFSGIVVVEADNVECAGVMEAFYADPQNVRPVPMTLLRRLFQECGLRLSSILFTSPIPGSNVPPTTQSTGEVPASARNYQVCLAVATRQ